VKRVVIMLSQDTPWCVGGSRDPIGQTKPDERIRNSYNLRGKTVSLRIVRWPNVLPTPSIYVSRFTPATQFGVLVLPPRWDGGLHPTPNRQAFFVLSGVSEVELSSGERRRFAAGQMLVGEDTTGKGHYTRVVGDEQLVLATVHLPA
jgi:mannose-6-phosphate isomerase-like protein (cupin superfamily)